MEININFYVFTSWLLFVAHSPSLLCLRPNIKYHIPPKIHPQRLKLFFNQLSTADRKLTGHFHFMEFVHKNTEKMHS